MNGLEPAKRKGKSLGRKTNPTFSGMVRVVFRINTENFIKLFHLRDDAKTDFLG